MPLHLELLDDLGDALIDAPNEMIDSICSTLDKLPADYDLRVITQHIRFRLCRP